jgi:hypothetical protein
MRNIEIILEIGTLFTKPYGDGWIRTSNPRVDQRIDLLGQRDGPISNLISIFLIFSD